MKTKTGLALLVAGIIAVGTSFKLTSLTKYTLPETAVYASQLDSEMAKAKRADTYNYVYLCNLALASQCLARGGWGITENLIRKKK